MSDLWVMIPVISVAGFYFMVMVIVMVVSKSKQQRAAMRAEVQTRMLDKFSSAPEFVSFLQSEDGKKFATSFEEVPRTHARDRILGGVTRSIVLTVLGVAFLLINLTEARDVFFVVSGIILLALGIGYFAATYITLKMSRSWGLLPTDANAAQADTRS